VVVVMRPNSQNNSMIPLTPEFQTAARAFDNRQRKEARKKAKRARIKKRALKLHKGVDPLT
jgi:hypothetical protein